MSRRAKVKVRFCEKNWGRSKMKISRCLWAGIAAMSLSATAAKGQDPPEPGPDDLMFSIENMDLGVVPAEDFCRFASGAGLDRGERPENLASHSFCHNPVRTHHTSNRRRDRSDVDAAFLL